MDLAAKAESRPGTGVRDTAAEVPLHACPAGILRMEDRQPSIVIQSQLVKQFTINFMTDYVSATVGEVDARLEGDTWIVTRDNGEVYEVPLTAIEFSCMRCSTTSTALGSPAFVTAGGAHLHGLARGRLTNPSKTLCGLGQSEIDATLL